MNAPQKWLMRLNSSRTGLWSVVWPMGSLFEANSLNDMSPPEVVTVVLHIDISNGVIVLRCRDSNTEYSDLAHVFTCYEREADELGRHSVRIIVDGFHEASIHQQCALVDRARAVQENATSISFQHVFSGRWGYYAFRSGYRQIHGHASSPPAHSKDVVQVPSMSVDNLLTLLAERRLMGMHPSEVERVASEYLVEQTAGDEFLIHQAIQYLEQLGGNWANHVEQVVDRLVESESVITNVKARLQSLDVKSRNELTKLLKVQCLVRGFDSIETERLWLAGLVRLQNIDGAKQFVQLAGPLVNAVLRCAIHVQRPGSVALPHDLCFERNTITKAAFWKISKIEIMLRNLIVAIWYGECGEKWTDHLEGIKTLSRDQERDDEVLRLVEAILQSKLVQLGLAPQEQQKESLQSATPQKNCTKDSLLNSALDWQKRRHDQQGVELAHYNLMQFLTTEGLVSALVNKQHGLHGQGKPFRKEFLVTALEEYLEIRSAVAHNQALKLSTISKLDVLFRKLSDWLTVYADNTLEVPP